MRIIPPTVPLECDTFNFFDRLAGAISNAVLKEICVFGNYNYNWEEHNLSATNKEVTINSKFWGHNYFFDEQKIIATQELYIIKTLALLAASTIVPLYLNKSPAIYSKF